MTECKLFPPPEVVLFMFPQDAYHTCNPYGTATSNGVLARSVGRDLPHAGLHFVIMFQALKETRNGNHHSGTYNHDAQR
jgi:hypothetical protein